MQGGVYQSRSQLVSYGTKLKSKTLYSHISNIFNCLFEILIFLIGFMILFVSTAFSALLGVENVTTQFSIAGLNFKIGQNQSPCCVIKTLFCRRCLSIFPLLAVWFYQSRWSVGPLILSVPWSLWYLLCFVIFMISSWLWLCRSPRKTRTPRGSLELMRPVLTLFPSSSC